MPGPKPTRKPVFTSHIRPTIAKPRISSPGLSAKLNVLPLGVTTGPVSFGPVKVKVEVTGQNDYRKPPTLWTGIESGLARRMEPKPISEQIVDGLASMGEGLLHLFGIRPEGLLPRPALASPYSRIVMMAAGDDSVGGGSTTPKSGWREVRRVTVDDLTGTEGLKIVFPEKRGRYDEEIYVVKNAGDLDRLVDFRKAFTIYQMAGGQSVIVLAEWRDPERASSHSLITRGLRLALGQSDADHAVDGWSRAATGYIQPRGEGLEVCSLTGTPLYMERDFHQSSHLSQMARDVAHHFSAQLGVKVLFPTAEEYNETLNTPRRFGPR